MLLVSLSIGLAIAGGDNVCTIAASSVTAQG
jgi:hypothetical protein